jgi:indolepyruvate ferredoxin oxidoreductase, beta subunit
VLEETARHLALWMSYEDTVRVADLKTRRSRFERVAREVRLSDAQQLDIHEFLHPRVEEIADTLPAALGRWLLRTGWARALVGRFTQQGRKVQTSSLRGYLLLYGIAALRGLRRRSLRYQVEHQRIRAWLGTVVELAPDVPALALEVARTQRLVKGYGDTHARGWRNHQRVMAVLPQLRDAPDGPQRLKHLSQAALADDTGAALDALLPRAAT